MCAPNCWETVADCVVRTATELERVVVHSQHRFPAHCRKDVVIVKTVLGV